MALRELSWAVPFQELVSHDGATKGSHGGGGSRNGRGTAIEEDPRFAFSAQLLHRKK